MFGTSRTVVLSAAVAFAVPAAAQEAPAPADTTTAAGDQTNNDAQTTDTPATATEGEIVVTARRRAESLQDVLRYYAT